ncbi:MAG: hypothetical protein M1812_005593 [Candelaria pacifica]|nr:MAG: hypothetical protein M1812_005593 [Candelaria pacifica]
MPSLLRRRPTCFYCGCRSAQKQDGHIRQWRCEKCEAVNYLDENGEITDPPAPEAATPVQYAHAVPRAASPVVDETLFCSQCLQNQHFLTQSLASYLPPQNDPNYANYEISYPEYRASLEKRYPQVCAQCEPRVRAKIRASGYLAKTDHLRRMMEKTRGSGNRFNIKSWGWRDAVVLVGASAWWISFAGQILWNVMGVTVSLEGADGLRAEDNPGKIRACLDQLLQRRATEESCVLETTPIARVCLLLGMVSIWWNNRLFEKAQGTGGRMVGLSEYYKLQIFVLATRVVVWWALNNAESVGMSPVALKGAHGFMLAFITSSIIFSLRTVKIDHTPRFTFHDNYEPVAPQEANNSRTTSSRKPYTTPEPSQSSQYNSRSPNSVRPFPINSLAPASQKSYPSYHDPPTPPPESPVFDSMDWTPTQKTFNPAPPRQLSQPKPALIESSPFYGRLPQAPISKAHQLRNPPNQLSFRKASEQKQQNFFNSVGRRSSEDDGDDDSPTKGGIDMAPPKFFTQQDRADTGLESLFDAAFSLGDEPREVKAARQRRQKLLNQQNSSFESPSPISNVLSVCLLILALSAWKLANWMHLFRWQLRMSAAVVVTFLAGKALLRELQSSQRQTSVRRLVLSSLNAAGSLALGSFSLPTTGISKYMGSELVDIVGTVLLGSMIIRELWSLVSAPVSASIVQAPYQQETQEQHSPGLDIARALADTSPPSQHQETRRGNQTSAQPRTTRSKTQRQSFVPSSSLSGLSLGGGGADSDGGSPSPVSSSTILAFNINGYGDRTLGSWNSGGRQFGRGI